MARAMDLPAIVGMSGVCGKLAGCKTGHSGRRAGRLAVHPTAAREEEYSRTARNRAVIQKRLAKLKAEARYRQQDGHAVVLSANIEMPSDVDAVQARGARIGLFRSEYLFMGEGGEPGEERQYRAYAEVARRIMPESVIIRTLDLGGDKIAAAGKIPEEANPFLGWRAIRLCPDRPACSRPSCAPSCGLPTTIPGLRIMYPMISSAGEVDRANALLEECKTELHRRGRRFQSRPRSRRHDHLLRRP